MRHANQEANEKAATAETSAVTPATGTETPEQPQSNGANAETLELMAELEAMRKERAEMQKALSEKDQFLNEVGLAAKEEIEFLRNQVAQAQTSNVAVAAPVASGPDMTQEEMTEYLNETVPVYIEKDPASKNSDFSLQVNQDYKIQCKRGAIHQIKRYAVCVVENTMRQEQLKAKLDVEYAADAAILAAKQ